MMSLRQAFDTIAAAYSCPDVSISEAIEVIRLDAFKAGGLYAANRAQEFPPSEHWECQQWLREYFSNLNKLP